MKPINIEINDFNFEILAVDFGLCFSHDVNIRCDLYYKTITGNIEEAKIIISKNSDIYMKLSNHDFEYKNLPKLELNGISICDIVAIGNNGYIILMPSITYFCLSKLYPGASIDYSNCNFDFIDNI